MNGLMTLSLLDGYEVKPGVVLIGEPTPIPGSNKLRALANVYGQLAVVELSMKFAKPVEVWKP